MQLLKLPEGQYINLAFIRELQADDDRLTVRIIWHDGDSDVFRANKAQAILEAVAELATDKSYVTSVIAP